MGDHRGHPNDIIICVVGRTGSGKTSFINTLTGSAVHHRQDGLMSDTKDITPYFVSNNGSRVVLVDTPGLDIIGRSDFEIFKDIDNWLKRNYPDGTTLKPSGIIYLHRIIEDRAIDSAHLRKFLQLCGNIPLRRVRLVTTMWDEASPAEAENKETKLKDEFWRKLIDEGAVVRRLDNTPNSAKGIVEDLIRLGQNGSRHISEEDKDVSMSCLDWLFGRRR